MRSPRRSAKSSSAAGGHVASVGHELNLGSPKQLEQVLFYELDLPKGKRTKTGYSTAAAVLEGLRRRPRHRGAPPGLAHLSKLKSTYIDALPALVNPETGRVHTSFNQTATETGRLSSSDPNLQNIPIRTEVGRRVRRAFVAREGWKLLASDYSRWSCGPGPHLRGPRAAGRLRARRGHPRHHGGGHLRSPLAEVTADDAAAGQGGQLRGDLRHERLRPLPAHRLPPGRPPVHRVLLRRLPRILRYIDDVKAGAPGAGLRRDAAGTAPLHPRVSARDRRSCSQASGGAGWPSTCPSRAPPRTS